MSHSHLVSHEKSSRKGLLTKAGTLGLGWLVAVVAMVVMPSTARAAWQNPPAPTVAEAGRHETGAGPRLCRPEPPDYPGCSLAQVRPLLRMRFAREYTGHAAGYRYRRMGQHPRGVIFAHLRPSLNAKLARLYRAAVARYVERHQVVERGHDGLDHEVVTYPRYRTWSAFKANATSLCTGNDITVHFPTAYCWGLTKLGQAGAVLRTLFYHTAKIVFACNGFAIGGFASGTFAAWRLGIGLLSGGFYGAVGVEIACQTTNLWNWATSLW